MSSKTTNLNLHKIDLTDAPPDITILNQNWDILDERVHNIPNEVSENITPNKIGAQKRMWQVAEDLHNIVDNIFVRWDRFTANTPYTAGLTDCDVGSCYVDMVSENFITIYCFTTTLPVPRIFAQSCQTEGWTTTWSDWIEFSSTNITMGTEEPTGGNDGDIYFQYEA